MISQSLQQKAIMAMMAFNAAVRNVRLYPATSALTVNSIEKAYQTVVSMLKTEESLVFAESERKLLVCDQTMSKKDREKPQVKAFEEMLVNFRIRSIAFHQGLEKEELATILDILKNDPDDPENEEAIRELFHRDDLPHIVIDEKVYVAMSEDYEVIARKDENRGKLVKETFVPMVETLDGILDEGNKETVSRQLAKSMASKDEDSLSMVLTQKYDNELGGRLFNHLLNMLDDSKFEKLVNTIKEMVDDISAEAESKKGKKRGRKSRASTLSEDEKQTVVDSYRKMLDSDKGERVKVIIRAREERERMEKERARRRIKEGITRVFQGDPSIFKDGKVMEAIPANVERFFDAGKSKTADSLMKAAAQGLLSSKENDRKNAAVPLAAISEKLVAKDRTESLLKLSSVLVQWIVSEDRVTEQMEKVADGLAYLSRRLIEEGRFSFCRHILEAFRRMESEESDKGEQFAELADKTLGKVVSPEAVGVLSAEFRSNSMGKRDQVAPILVQLGKSLTEPLLDDLLAAQDKFERIRIARVITDIGRGALTAVEQRLYQGGPKSFVGALLAIMGRIGTEDQVDAVQTYLTHKEPLLRREALNAVNSIGGDRRGPIFLSVLDDADDRLKIDLVGALGAMEERSATTPLLELLKSKGAVSAKGKAELNEKICIALGNIGSYEAVPLLESIVYAKKGLLKIKGPPENVQAAAERAIKMIREKKWTEPEPERKTPAPSGAVEDREESPEARRRAGSNESSSRAAASARPESRAAHSGRKGEKAARQETADGETSEDLLAKEERSRDLKSSSGREKGMKTKRKGFFDFIRSGRKRDSELKLDRDEEKDVSGEPEAEGAEKPEKEDAGKPRAEAEVSKPVSEEEQKPDADKPDVEPFPPSPKDAESADEDVREDEGKKKAEPARTAREKKRPQPERDRRGIETVTRIPSSSPSPDEDKKDEEEGKRKDEGKSPRGTVSSRTGSKPAASAPRRSSTLEGLDLVTKIPGWGAPLSGESSEERKKRTRDVFEAVTKIPLGPPKPASDEKADKGDGEKGDKDGKR